MEDALGQVVRALAAKPEMLVIAIGIAALVSIYRIRVGNPDAAHAANGMSSAIVRGISVGIVILGAVLVIRELATITCR